MFNAGEKGAGVTSGFSEADSMGTNMLRFGLWVSNESLPTCSIITGEPNPSAEHFASREHFDALYAGVKNKGEALEHLVKEFGVEKNQIACVFDDINDLGMAAECGVKALVGRRSSPLLQDFVVREGLCDYVSAASGGNTAVREICELFLGLMGKFDTVVRSRAASDDAYRRYFAARQSVETSISGV